MIETYTLRCYDNDGELKAEECGVEKECVDSFAQELRDEGFVVIVKKERSAND